MSQISGGVLLPLARKSIHNHSSCPFAKSEMGRYGLNKRSNEQSNPPIEQGSDVVDNVMSKHASLSPSKRYHIPKRNSLTPTKEQYSDESDDDHMLSKSLPATLPTNLNYSVDIEDWSPNNYQSNRLQNSYEYATGDTTGSRRRNNTSNSSDYKHSPVSLSTKLKEYERQTSSEPKNRKLYYVLASLVAIYMAYILTMYFVKSETKIDKYDETRFSIDLDSLKEKYRINFNPILQVQTGVSTIFKKEDTGSFIFVYNSRSYTFNQDVFRDFVNGVASSTARYLRNDSIEIHHHIVVNSSSLDMDNHYKLMEEYREDVTRTGVMLVWDLDNVPSDLAMAFHYYCDEYDPLVKKSAIFFTLDLARCSSISGHKSIHTQIENCLMKKWTSVKEDNIRPLLTRVVNVVVDLTSI